MDTLRRILVTTDFSDNARNAYPCAVSLAKKFGAAVYLVHLAHRRVPVFARMSHETYVDELRKALDEEGSWDGFDDVHVETQLIQHVNVPEALRAFERAANIDLAVTSTHGRTGLQHLVLGSFAERILRNSCVPVLVKREQKEAGINSEPRQVLVPFDFSDAALSTFPIVRFLASHYGCAFRFLFVYETQPDRIGLYEKMWKAIAGQPESTEQYFTALKQSELADIDVELDTGQGVPAIEIVHRARDTKADLIVIGTHGTLGSVAQNVTRVAHCPVLIVPRKNHDKHNH